MSELLRERLLTILFGFPAAVRAAGADIAASGEWPALFQMAQTWSVPCQLGERLEQCAVKPPAGEWREFQKVRIAAFAHSAAKAAKGVAALRHLESAGIAAVAFKGLASMATLYTPAANRMIKDVDLVVTEANQASAVQALRAIGYLPAEGCDLEGWNRFVDNSPGFSGNKAMVLTDAQGLEIDLHWSVGMAGMEPESLLARRRMATLFAMPVPVVSAVDALHLTTRHAVRENLAIDTVCRDLFDIRQGCARLAASGELRAALEKVATTKSGVPLLVLTRVLDTLSGERGEAAALLGELVTPSEQKAAAQLEALFFHQAKHGPITKDLLYLFHSRPAKQILTGALTDWREYRKFMQSMEEKLDGAEVPLGLRLRQATAGLKSIGRSQWRGMRHLASLKYEG